MAAKQDVSSDGKSHDLPFNDSGVQLPSYTITFGQLQDLVRTQTSLATRLMYAVSIFPCKVSLSMEGQEGSV